MKKILFLVLLVSAGTLASAQSLGRKDLDALMPLVQAENWKQAFLRSSELLKVSEGDTSRYRASVVYYNLLSGAGMLIRGELKKKDLAKAARKLQGQQVLMPLRTVSDDASSFSKIRFEQGKAMTATANARGTFILCQEEFSFERPVDPSSFPEGTLLRCGGKLTEIELNEDKALIWVFRLTVTGAFVAKN